MACTSGFSGYMTIYPKSSKGHYTQNLSMSMKRSSRDKQLGSALPLESATSQSGQTNHPSENETGLDVNHHTPHLSEGRGEVFFLDILFHRMSVIAILRHLVTARHLRGGGSREESQRLSAVDFREGPFWLVSPNSHRRVPRLSGTTLRRWNFVPIERRLPSV